MQDFFVYLLNMSITASYAIIAVIILRLFLKKAPKKFSCALWGIVAFRLVCPVSFESPWSLIPSAQSLPHDILYAATPQINSGIPALNHAVNPILENSFSAEASFSANPMQIAMFFFSIVWIIVLTILLIYAAAAYIRLKRKIASAVPLQENVFESENISSPFLFGFFQPKIYLPLNIDKQHMAFVIEHEKAHIKRCDHWLKLLAYLLLCIYWFNPLIWLAYILFCRDIESACDEKVIDKLGEDVKKSYSSALLYCSLKRAVIPACPLAFGEIGVKQRIKNILSYKKLPFWAIATLIIVMVVLGVCLMTNPAHSDKSAIPIGNSSEIYSNYAFDELIYSHPLSSYMPTANEMPYFRITADTFGASPDRYGALSHIIEPFFQNPNYRECELDSSFFDHAADDDGFDDKLCQLIDIQSSVKILEVLDVEMKKTGYYIIFADKYTYLAYHPGTISSYVISLRPISS